MTVFDASSLKFWETVGLWGFVFVWVGVAGEGVEISIKIFRPKLYEEKKKPLDRIGAVFWIVLVLALATEFLGNVKAMRIADAENVRLEGLASAANERAANTESNNLVLQKEIQNSDRKNWRVYSLTAEAVLTFSLKPNPGPPELNFPAHLIISDSSNESFTVSFDCGNAINEAIPPDNWYPQYVLLFPRPIHPSNIGRTLWFGNTSAVEFANALDSTSLTVSNFPISDVENVRGNVVIAINESVWKKFEIAPTSIHGGCATLSGTRGVVRFFKP